MTAAVDVVAGLPRQLAAANLDIDRLLTSFDVAFWRVREPRSGLTVGHRLLHLTDANVIAAHVWLRRAAPGELDDIRDPGHLAGTSTTRPAVLLRNWRGSCTRLRDALHAPPVRGMTAWLSRYVDELRALEQACTTDYAQWADGSRHDVGRRRSIGGPGRLGL